MKRKMDTGAPDASPEMSPVWATLEAYARGKIQELLQALLDEEVTAFLGRAKYERGAGASGGYRNGYGKRRRVTLMNGPVVVRRPRVRGLEERCESQLLPFFKNQTAAVTGRRCSRPAICVM